MEINYNKLRKLMTENNLEKSDLKKAAGLSAHMVSKISNNEEVSLKVLTRICKVFNCEIGDICEIILDEK